MKGSQEQQSSSFLVEQNAMSNVKKVIGIVSGKGGVGKSLITSMLAVLMNRKGYRTAVLDADITGPSIPKAFGIQQQAQGIEQGILPVVSKTGISIMSINFLLQNTTDPVVWRGPIIAGVIKQFWSDVIWGDIDFMFVDLPPGTGDAPLTIFQSLPVDGVIIVTSPQALVSMIVSKAVKMAQLMNVPILGMVENMSYLKCPDCGTRVNVFGESHIQEIAETYNIDVLAELPIDIKLSSMVDQGLVEDFQGNWLDSIVDILKKMEE
ncbi:MAG: Mrp/NBP35 family ATP-binding protein [Firmicutes bacterium]|nr:Mrp/NBP35 family ATP-binding protein [Bacillota bacterium]